MDLDTFKHLLTAMLSSEDETRQVEAKQCYEQIQLEHKATLLQQVFKEDGGAKKVSIKAEKWWFARVSV